VGLIQDVARGARLTPIDRQSVRIRPADPADAADVGEVLFEAIRQTAAASYPAEVIASWATPVDAGRIEQIRQAIAGRDELCLVAEHEAKVVGFGSIVPAAGELRAVYVHPAVGRSGVGSALLLELEQLARARGLPELHMDASINAEAFYAHHGYLVVARGVHHMSSGGQMACVKMRKPL
jgi:putative acetyltransferase